jgi:hypothetical protein
MGVENGCWILGGMKKEEMGAAAEQFIRGSSVLVKR